MPAKENLSQEIVVPELGESVLEATVSHWLKQEGETVRVGEVLVELETDKVNLEVGAKSDGILKKIERQENEDVQVGDVLGIIVQAEGETGDGQGEPSPEEAQEVNGRKEEKPSDQKPIEETGRPDSSDADRGAGIERATPVAERLAREHNLDMSQIQGSGPGGRVTKSDVESFLKDREAQPPVPEKEAVAEAPATRAAKTGQLAPLEDGRREERVRMSRRRRTIAQRLVEAQQTAAMLTTFNEVDMSAVMEMRTRHNEIFQKRHGVKLGFMSFFVKASIGALKAYPRVNAELDADEMVLKHYYDKIGRAHV